MLKWIPNVAIIELKVNFGSNLMSTILTHECLNVTSAKAFTLTHKEIKGYARILPEVRTINHIC